ncbi:hypothetical protein [Azospirillum agricola]|uniref:hypothetical protein n=1 Tax=Azospirillum agricola TaxID=1720247 RepID=UPI000A0F0CDF|nr:hypothetical protein [Azospirillum agricola]SMH55638.1 hypothetical protein SAMN02982994_3867 [Azospirillum lipoferum]
MNAALGRVDLMVPVLETLLLLACLAWILASAARAARHVLMVQRRRAVLDKRHADLERDLSSVRRSVRQQDGALRHLEKALADKQEEVEAAQTRLNALRGEGRREYELLSERFGEKDKLWLLTVPRDDRPARWAVAAPDPQTASDLLTKRVTTPERPEVEGQM